MRNIYVFLTISFLLIGYNSFAQMASFTFDPNNPCSNSPVTFKADTTGFNQTFPWQSSFVWYIDNVWSGYGAEFTTTIPFGWHDITLYATDSVVPIFDDTTRTIFFDSICYLNTLSGTAFYDLNANGVQDLNEPGVNNGLIKVKSTVNNTFYTFCDQNGFYQLNLDSGEYDINIQVNNSYYNITFPVAAPHTHSAVFSGTGATSTNNDFGIIASSASKDLYVGTWASPLRPGFFGHIYTRVGNFGNYPDTAIVKIELDNNTPFITSVPLPDSIDGKTIYYSFIDIPPHESEIIELITKIDSTIPLGTRYNMSSMVKPRINEVDTLNNFDSLSWFFLGAFDPNDKLVFPNDDSLNAFERGDYLTYTIRFQNVGTFFAEDVRIVDEMESNLNLNSFQMLAASHAYSYQIMNNRKVVWRFDDIMLPAAQDNEPESHGFVKFRIMADSAISLGDTVYNSAEIYFDFNLPIITNTIVSTLDSFVTVSITDHSLEEGSVLNIYPNPFNDEINIELVSSSNIQFELFSMQGDRILIQSIENQGQIKMNQLSPGMYLYKAIDDSGKIQRGKLIKN